MTRTMILATVAVSLLSGCMSPQQLAMTKAKERLVVARATCKEVWGPGHFSERADCFTAAENSILGPLVMNEGDLLMLYQARRKVLAMKFDRHEITLEELKLEDMEAQVAAKQQAIDRNNAASMVNAAWSQSTPILVPVTVRHRH